MIQDFDSEYNQSFSVTTNVLPRNYFLKTNLVIAFLVGVFVMVGGALNAKDISSSKSLFKIDFLKTNLLGMKNVGHYVHKPQRPGQSNFGSLWRTTPKKVKGGTRFRVVLCRRSDKSHRKEAGTIDFNAVAAGIKDFRYVRLDVLLHDDVVPKLDSLLTAGVSADNGPFKPLPLKRISSPEKLSGGFALYRLNGMTAAPVQQLRITISPKLKRSSHIQLVGLVVSGKPIPESFGKASEAVSPNKPALKPLPRYALLHDDLPLPEFHARQLVNEAELSKVAFTDFWGNVKLSDKILSVNYTGTTRCQRKGQPKLGFIYRAAILADFTPGRERIMLDIPIGAFVTTVLINGREIARFTEGFLPLEADITDSLKPGEEAELQIRTIGYLSGVLDEKGVPRYATGSAWRWTGGLAGIPHLRKVSAIRPVDLAASPTKGQLKLQSGIVNQTGSEFKGKAQFVVTDPDGKEIFSHEQPVRVKAGGRIDVSHTFVVKDELKLWDIGRPNLYFAELRLNGNAEPAVGKVRFGYRYVEIRGEDFYLNGRHVRLRGPWGHRSDWLMPRLSIATGKRDRAGKPRKTYLRLMKLGMNAARLHRQPFPKAFYSDADEVGYLIIAESAIPHTLMPDDAVFAHIKRFVKSLRNHPSVVIWSGINEYQIWLTPRTQKSMDFLVRLRSFIQDNDPSRRPVQHSGFGDANGKLDIYSVHYPAEKTGGRPKLLYWTRDPLKLTRKLYNHNFKTFNPLGKKPIFYGEELMPNIRRDLHSMFTGEAGLRDYYQGKTNLKQSRKSQLDTGLVWRYHIRAAREQNIGMSPPIVFYAGLESVFADCLKQEYRPAGAYPIFPIPILAKGEKNLRRFAIFEDDGYPFEGRVTVALEQENTSKQKEILADFKVKIDGGTVQEKELQLIPVSTGRKYLTTRLADKTGKVIYIDRTPVRVVSPLKPKKLNMTVQVWGENAAFTEFAAKYGIKTVPVDPALSRPGILVVMPEVPEAEIAAKAGAVSKFIKRGGRLLVFERRWNESFLPGNARFTAADSFSCVGFVRNPTHPALAGMDDLDFKYWNPDLTVTGQTAIKTASGNTITLVDGESGLQNQFLWEFRYGDGIGIVNHLALLANWLRLPQAEKLLYNILSYLKNGKLQTLTTPRLLAGAKDDPAESEFIQLGAKKNGDGELLIVTGKASTELPSKEILKTAAAYRNVVFLNPSRDAAVELGKALTGTAPPIKTASKSQVSELFYTGDLPLYAGLTSTELNWDSPWRPDYQFVFGNGWQTAIFGGRDAIKSNARGGTVLFLNLPYHLDVPKAERRDEFTTKLLTNLGAKLDMRMAGNRVNDASRFKPVNLGSANASRSAIFSDFPTGTVVLDGTTFRIPSESAAAPHAMLRFSGHARLPENVKVVFDTPLDKFNSDPGVVRIKLPENQAESIRFLLTSTYNWKLKKKKKGETVAVCRLLYRDGTSAEFSLRRGVHLNSARDINAGVTVGKQVLELPIKINAPGEKGKIFVVKWLNPHPEKKIERFEIHSSYNPPHDLLIFGITLETTDKAYI